MRRHKGAVVVFQNSMNMAKRPVGEPHVPFFAKILIVHSDRNTCDIETLDGFAIKNVPLCSKVGLVNGKIYGVLDLPEVDDYVLIIFGGPYRRNMIIMDTITPYLKDEFQVGQSPVNSTNKAYTAKLFEANKEKTYRKIFKSGTTLEVQDDGTLILETPSGTFIKIDESAGGTVAIEDANGNTFSMETGKTVINGNLEVLQ